MTDIFTFKAKLNFTKKHLLIFFLLSLLIIAFSSTAKADVSVTFTLVKVNKKWPHNGQPKSTDIMQIKNGSKINIDKVGKNLNIRANVHSPLDPSLVKFDYDGRHFNNEKTEPFALAGDVNGKYNAWMPSFGRHWVEVMVFKSDGRFAGRKRVSFTVVSDQGSTDNISLTLVNTSNSNKPVDLFELEERKENTIDLSRTGNALNIRVDVNRKVWHKYVVFYWQRQYYDPQKRIEKRIPYYFYGDRNGKPVSWKPPLGKIYLTVAVVDKNNKAMFSTTTRLNIIK